MVDSTSGQSGISRDPSNTPDEFPGRPAAPDDLDLTSDHQRTSRDGIVTQLVRGDQVGENYEILAPLAAGGMGQVYRVRHRRLDREFALKVILSRAISPEAVARFEREMKAAGRTNHPNVILATDAGESRGRHYLVMELVPGTDLANLVKRLGRLSIPDACELVRQAALGLQAIHEAGLVHRDIKPSNLMLTPDGVVKVLDLGLARLVGDPGGSLPGDGSLHGTADYMAPEQAFDPHAATITTDIYSLGCTLYCLLAGYPPFGDGQYPSVISKLMAHREQPIPPIESLRPELAPLTDLLDLLGRMLAKTPTARPREPKAVAEALGPFTTGQALPRLLDPNHATAAELSNANAVLPGPPITTNPRRSLRKSAAIVGLGAAALFAAWGLNPRGRGLPPSTPTVPAPMPPAPAVPAPSALRVESFEVRHYRGNPSRFQGPIGAISLVTRLDDNVKVAARLSAPAYCYLLALNPDGSVQICPGSAENTPPLPTTEINYPAEPDGYYGLTDGTGIQMFVLVASTDPLPAFAQWQARERIPWSRVESESAWQFNGAVFMPLGMASRGTERRLPSVPPVPIEAVCGYLQNLPDVDTVQATAFPVLPADPPRTDR